MKPKNFSNVTVNLKLLLILPVIILVLVAHSSCTARKTSKTGHTEILPPPPPPPPPPEVMKSQTEKSETEPFIVVEEMPIFPGGDSALIKYISKNIKYPPVAKINKIQGRVIVRFCVTEAGSINRINIMKGVNPDLDAEAIRVVGTLPTFIPGKQGGKAVDVWYMIPIAFTLN